MSSPAAGSCFYYSKSQAIHLNRLSGGAGVMYFIIDQLDIHLRLDENEDDPLPERCHHSQLIDIQIH